MSVTSSSVQEDTKPQISNEDAIQLANRLFGLQVASSKELNSYDDRNYHLLALKSGNPYIKPVSHHGYILKVVNTLDSSNLPFFQAQTGILQLLKEKNFPAPIPLQSLAGQYHAVEELPYEDRKRKHIVRLFEFQPGKILKSVPGSLELYCEVGVWLGRLNSALKNFHHPGFESHTTMWHLKSVPILKSYLSYVSDEEKRSLAAEIVEKFGEKILPNIDRLEKGVIHGDFNEQNILVDCSVDGNWHICSVLDFGDTNFAPYLFEIAAAMCYMMLDAPRSDLNPVECGGQTLVGYQSIRPLTSLEHSLLKIAICSRLCQSLVLGLYTASIQPENLYVGDTQTNGWSVLKMLWEIPEATLSKAWPLSTLY